LDPYKPQNPNASDGVARGEVRESKGETAVRSEIQVARGVKLIKLEVEIRRLVIPYQQCVFDPFGYKRRLSQDD